MRGVRGKRNAVPIVMTIVVYVSMLISGVVSSEAYQKTVAFRGKKMAEKKQSPESKVTEKGFFRSHWKKLVVVGVVICGSLYLRFGLPNVLSLRNGLGGDGTQGPAPLRDATNVSRQSSERDPSIVASSSELSSPAETVGGSGGAVGGVEFTEVKALDFPTGLTVVEKFKAGMGGTPNAVMCMSLRPTNSDTPSVFAVIARLNDTGRFAVRINSVSSDHAGESYRVIYNESSLTGYFSGFISESKAHDIVGECLQLPLLTNSRALTFLLPYT